MSANLRIDIEQGDRADSGAAPYPPKGAYKPMLDMYTVVLDRLKADHSELTDLWKQLDSKAQATATICGAFLAIAFAGIKAPGWTLTPSDRVILLLAIGLLICGVGASLFAMFVRTMPSPPSPGRVLEMVNDIATLTPLEEHESRHVGLLADMARLWVGENHELHNLSRRKANAVTAAQSLLAFSIGVVATHTFLGVLFP